MLDRLGGFVISHGFATELWQCAKSRPPNVRLHNNLRLFYFALATWAVIMKSLRNFLCHLTGISSQWDFESPAFWNLSRERVVSHLCVLTDKLASAETLAAKKRPRIKLLKDITLGLFLHVQGSASLSLQLPFGNFFEEIRPKAAVQLMIKVVHEWSPHKGHCDQGE